MRERIGEIGANRPRGRRGGGDDRGPAGGQPGGAQQCLGAQAEYFWKMNTRASGSTATEMTTGIDIVRGGARRPPAASIWPAVDVAPRGHAIECRINAEDASKNFAPAPGSIGRYAAVRTGVRLTPACGRG